MKKFTQWLYESQEYAYTQKLAERLDAEDTTEDDMIQALYSPDKNLSRKATQSKFFNSDHLTDLIHAGHPDILEHPLTNVDHISAYMRENKDNQSAIEYALRHPKSIGKHVTLAKALGYNPNSLDF